MLSLVFKARSFALLALIIAGCNGPREQSTEKSSDVGIIEGSGSTCSSLHRPRLVTDRDDYTTGLPVKLRGKGLECGKAYSLIITRPDGTTYIQALAADSSGTLNSVYMFDGQRGNYNAELRNSGGTLVAYVHFHGSHFRYGHLTWRTVGPRTAEFSLINAFRRDDYPGNGPDHRVITGDTFEESVGNTELHFGDGSYTSTLRYEVISYDIQQNWVIGRAISVGGTRTLPGTGVTAPEQEPNDSISSANFMNLGDDYASNIAIEGDSDFVGFTLAQRTRVSIRTVLNGLDDSRLYLYNSTGQELIDDDDSSDGFASLINTTLDAGTYYIRATGHASYIGQQTVQLRQSASMPTPTSPFTHTYNSDGPFIAYINECCRIGDLVNRNTEQDDDYIVRTPVRFNIANSSPVSSLPPIVNAPVNTPTFTFQVPAVDAEGDALTFRLATGEESGTYNPVPGLTVSSTGLVSWNTVGTIVGQLWTTQIVIEERRGGQLIGSSAVDFILRIVDTVGFPPECVLPAQTSYTVNAGNLIQFNIGTADQDSADMLTLNTGGIPPGATLTPALPRQGAPGIGTTFNWRPPASVAGSSYVVGFTVMDLTGQADQCSVSITVRPQQENQPPVTNAGDDQSVLEGDLVTLAGSGSDPNGDAISYSWSVVNSSGPAISLSDAASAAPSFATSDDGVYTLRLTVTDSEGASSSETVTVTVGNVAPAVSSTGGTIPQNTVFTSPGSFVDPGADNWTATVDYGDGSGAQSLPLNGKSFVLNHLYTAVGTYSVTIAVMDDEGAVGYATVQVVVTTECIEVALGDYNVFVLENYTMGADVLGKVAAGGNITMANFSVGAGLAGTDTANVMVSGGDMNLSNGGIWGDAVYGGSFNADASVSFVRGSASQGTPIDFVARGNELRALSSRLNGLAANGTTTVEAWGGVFFTGTSPAVNVFQVSTIDLASAWTLFFNAPAGSLVVLNVSGTTGSLRGGHLFSGGIDQRGVLFNFANATSFNVDAYGFWGTLLAPNADVTFNNGSFDGGIYAKSLAGNAEGHLNPLTNYTICQ
jgi:choice-of-anchor A domain-containing protein